MGNDMIVSLYTLPDYIPNPAIRIKRVYPTDRDVVCAFIRENFSEGWVKEAEYAMMQQPVKCFIAVEDKKVVGFACYDATAKGFFGPTGVLESERGKGLGKELLLRTLYAMKEDGYGYAIIGWTGPAEFYKKCVGAQLIPGATSDRSIYSNMLIFP